MLCLIGWDSLPIECAEDHALVPILICFDVGGGGTFDPINIRRGVLHTFRLLIIHVICIYTNTHVYIQWDVLFENFTSRQKQIKIKIKIKMIFFLNKIKNFGLSTFWISHDDIRGMPFSSSSAAAEVLDKYLALLWAHRRELLERDDPHSDR